MNQAITNTTSRTLQTLKRHYFTAFTGVSLTLIALVGSAALSEARVSRAGSPAPAPAARSSVAVQPYSQPAMTYYIAGSDEDAAYIAEEAQATKDDIAIHQQGRTWKFAILVASNPEAEASVMATIEQARARWAAAGASGLEIVDTREPQLRASIAEAAKPVIVYLVNSERRAFDIITSVESDRNESEFPQPRFFALKVTTAEEEAVLAGFLEGWAGRDLQVIDLRHQPAFE
jgi:hypothetical protein